MKTDLLRFQLLAKSYEKYLQFLDEIDFTLNENNIQLNNEFRDKISELSLNYIENCFVLSIIINKIHKKVMKFKTFYFFNDFLINLDLNSDENCGENTNNLNKTQFNEDSEEYLNYKNIESNDETIDGIIDENIATNEENNDFHRNIKSETTDQTDSVVSESVADEDSDEELNNNSNDFNYSPNTYQRVNDLNTRDQYICEYKGCSKIFKTKLRLKLHKIKHSDDYRCDWLGDVIIGRILITN